VSFDSLAWRYDDLFSRSRIGTQRGAVWDVLADTFRPGDTILVLNCRTREDAIFLATLDVSVVACDSAEGMMHTRRNHMEPEGPDAPIQLDLLPTEHLTKIRPGALFDGVLSNFSGLNSVADLNRTSRDLASMVAMGAPVIICLSTRFCLSETLWFLLHGKFRQAFRRSFGIATVKVGDCAVKMRYPALREVGKLFSPFFLMRSCTGIGVAVPPSYLEPIFANIPVCSAYCVEWIKAFRTCLCSGRSGITCSFTLSGWRRDAVERASALNMFSPSCGNNSCARQFGSLRDLTPQAMFRHGLEM
jgi:hypothetical protein